LTDREKEILVLIKQNPFIAQQDIANRLGITRSSVAVHITNLAKKGYIKEDSVEITNNEVNLQQ